MRKQKWMIMLLTVIMCLTVWLKTDISARAEGASSMMLENENVTVQLVNEYSELRITDKRTGSVWSSSMSDPAFDAKVSAKWQQKMTSLFSINTTNLAKGFGSVSTLDLTGTPYTAEEYATADGFGVIYDLTAPAIKLALEFSLTEDGVKIRIPQESIEEYGDTFSLVSVDLMVFFGASSEGRDGYFFYPDGSGAIMRFDDPAHLNEKSATYDVYGDITKTEALLGKFEDIDPTVMMPVFGGNYGESGFVAYMTDGAESSQITVTPAGNIIKANYMFPTLNYRRSFVDPRVTAKVVQTFDANLIQTDYEVCYRILPEGKAEYSDMAVAYREYLLENGLLNQDNADEEYPLILDIFMGIEEEGLIWNTFQSMTTFAQAKEILADIKENVGAKIEASLVGWTADGYGSEPKYFPVNRKLGGSSGLKKLVEFANQNDIGLSLAANFMTVYSGASGYSKNADVVYLSNYQLLTDTWETNYVVSPNVAAKNFEKFMKKASSYDISGVKLENIGIMSYYNYTKKNVVTAEECKQYWKDMLQKAKTQTGSVTAEGGNDYVLQTADRVMDIPLTDCGYQMTTESVPFYQIVVHGYVDYSGEAMNLSSDSDKLLLKWMEYGYVPYFEITAESADKLMQTDYNHLFSSGYYMWKDSIVEIYAALEEVLAPVQNVAIASHEKLAKNVFCTTYDNGTKIYVNYNDKAVKAEGIEIDAMGYKVMGGN